MKEEIRIHLQNPESLERMYRSDKRNFTTQFNLLYPEIKEDNTAQIWYQRLNFSGDKIVAGTYREWILVVTLAFIAGCIAKIPSVFDLDEELFFMRNIAFVVFPLLTLYFLRKQQIQSTRTGIIAAVFLLAVVYINLMQDIGNKDTFILACIHLPFILWAICGFAFSGNAWKSDSKRFDFLRFNGDLLVMSVILLIAGGLLSAATILLFELIDLDIAELFFNYVGIWGLAAIPIISTHLVSTNPQLVNKVSPVVARVFTPLVFLTLVAYLIAVIATGKDPYNDRDFLLLFNLILIGVLAIIFFSVAELEGNTKNKTTLILLLGLSLVTIVVNSIALTAIIFRISEWGFTPNRLAVLGGNILILIHLLMVTYRLIQSVKNNGNSDGVESIIVRYIPVYVAWAAFIVFILPFIYSI